MNVYDIADSVVALIADAADAINADTDLAASGFLLNVDASNNPDETDAHDRLKIDDRDNVDDGLTICVVVTGDSDFKRMTQFQVIKKATLDIVCYMAGHTETDGAVDPAKLVKARRGLRKQLVGLLNKQGNQIAIVAGDGTATGCRVTGVEFGPMPKPVMGLLVPSIVFSWEGKYHTLETEDNG